MVSRRPRVDRQPLSLERVIAAAIEVADADGLPSLTIRGLARRLGVEPMSLYHYVASRDELLAAMVERIAAQIEPPSATGDWRDAVRRSALSAYGVLRQHPWACNELMSGTGISASRLRVIDAMLGRLADAGLADELADLAYHALDSHILGFTLWQAGYTAGAVQLSGDELDAFLRTIHIEDYPNLQAHAAWHGQPRATTTPNEFEFGLDLILDGLERMAGGAGPRP